MDALRSQFPEVKIVWTVTLGRWYRIRTDATWFMPVIHNYYPRGEELNDLRYCTDIIAIDIGHMKVTNCDFVAYMPHLKYLLVPETTIRDLTPLTGLEELVYLELFLCGDLDLSPLLTLTALEDLNLSYSKGDPGIIAQMAWLKNLWWAQCPDQKMLREALPECTFNFVGISSTGMGWRELPNYYAQRDVFGQYYMRG